MSKAPIIICDTAEERSGIPQRLRDSGCAVETRTLAAGDYVISAAWAIERKAPRDLVDSIINRKLYRQLSELGEQYEHGSLLIEGDSWEGDRRLRRPMLGELYHWISMRPNLSVVYAPASKDSAGLLADLARREQFEDFSTKHAVVPASPRRVQEPDTLLLSLPGVGPAGVRKLVERFGDLRSVFQADRAELVEVLGPKRGAEIDTLLTTSFR
jgi:Fanconi anemia group M protein